MDAPLFLEYLEDLQHELAALGPYGVGAVADAEGTIRQRHRLQWLPADPQLAMSSPAAALSLDEARQDMLRVMRQTVSDGGVLLVRAKPGTGKTHAAVRLAQQHAAEGHRVLFLMPTHRHFETLADLPPFQPDLWYHWRATHHLQANGAPYCRYHKEAAVWASKGYSLMGMCRMLCPAYQKQCPYRRQANPAERIVAGVHEHLVSGLAIRDFSLVIVDELPLRAFLSPRAFSARDIAAVKAKADTPFAGLFHELLALATSEAGLSDAGVSGRALLDAIGPHLRTAYQYALHLLEEVRAGATIDEPLLSSPADVETAPPSILPPLLKAAIPEYKAWSAGADDWLSRIHVEGGQLRIDGRSNPWRKLREKATVLLDATGRADIYRELLGREVTDYEPPARMSGRVYQITNRLNGKRQLEDATSGYVDETKRLFSRIILQHDYRRPALVTFKALLGQFTDLFGDNVAHFYGQRGSNSLEHADALFVLGSPSPPGWQLLRTAAMLYADRMVPFAKAETPAGSLGAAFAERLLPFRHERAGLVPHRMTTGYWDDWNGQLEVLHGMYREDELLQAVHRARPLTREVDVWLLSSIPTTLPLAGIFDDWAEALGAPIIPCLPDCGPDCRHKNKDGTQRRIQWEHWSKLSDWLFALDEPTTLDADTLARVTGTNRQYVSHERWLPAIAQAWPDRCDVASMVYRPGRKLATRWDNGVHRRTPVL